MMRNKQLFLTLLLCLITIPGVAGEPVQPEDLEPERVIYVPEAEWNEANARLRLLETGPRPQEVRAAEAEIARLEARRRLLQDRVERTTIVSPIAGTVTTPRIDERQNVYVSRGELIAEVQQLRTVRVELSVSEKEMGDVVTGSPVDVKVLAYPDRTFRGQVTKVAPAAAPAKGEDHARRFVVTTYIRNDSLLLSPGMTGKAKIRRGPRRIIELVMRKLSHYVRIEFWSWW